MAIMAAVLGPVLAALFVAELATEGHWRESSPAPSRQEPVADRSGGVTDSDEPATRDPDDPGAVPSAGDSGDGESSEGKDKGNGKDGGKSKDGDGDTSPDPDGGSSSDPSDDSSSAPGGPGATHRPTPSNPRPTAPATVVPTPTPTPSETCTRFLWWCT
ncbi:Collagen adhesion protein [Streptomyces malaysiensis]|uniref:Collagen adhesion protein n=1 Tax=Streptomyces malaysiensis TaxID=92644 RepID=A0A7X5X225_STRMQ|nr:Collagen adhesion protein [Streptomyces malaysiensis]